MPAEKQKPPGLLSWLGRQVGFVRKAIKADVAEKVIYRTDSVEELPHPSQPGVKLRRTVVDEVVRDPEGKAKA